MKKESNEGILKIRSHTVHWSLYGKNSQLTTEARDYIEDMLCRAHDNGQLYADQEDGSRAHGWWHVPRPTTKFHLHLLFGSGLVSDFNDNGVIPADAEDKGACEYREFDTEAERNAYLQALRDSNGWMDFCTLDDTTPELDEWWQLQEETVKEAVTGISRSESDEPEDLACVWNQHWRNLPLERKQKIYDSYNLKPTNNDAE